MVVKHKRILELFLTCLLFCACNSNQKDIRSILSKDQGTNKLISRKYYDQVPLAQLINMEPLSSLDTTFTLATASPVHIYATGELNVNLADVPRKYFFKGDDVELFFKKPFVFPYLHSSVAKDTCRYQKDGIQYTCNYDNYFRSYTILLSFPWTTLQLHPMPDTSFNFDIAAADDDNYVNQKVKLAWRSKTDPLYSSRITGKLFLTNELKPSANSSTVYSIKKSVKNNLDTMLWKGLPKYDIQNLVLGDISEKQDLSASFQTCWDEQGLNFLIKVKDANKGEAVLQNIMNYHTFHDYGWIEDDKGKNVWNMHALYSHYAGGAQKNQQVDTTISLKAGKYKLRYVTDESHSWNNWDDKPPHNVFYGIVIYKE